jgi:hypothetical protein
MLKAGVEKQKKRKKKPSKIRLHVLQRIGWPERLLPAV